MDKKTENRLFPAKLYTVRRNGRTWLVLAIHERERLNSFSLDCVAEDGAREDFTCGGKELAGLREVQVTITT